MVARREALAILAVGALLAGCGGSTKAAAPRPSAPPVTSTDGSFQTALPSKFQDITGSPDTGSALFAAGDRSDRMTLTVSRFITPSSVTLSYWADNQRQIIHGAHHAHGFTAVQKLTVSGAPARSLGYLADSPLGRNSEFLEVAVSRNRSLYTITGLAQLAHQRLLRDAVSQVMAHWRWR